MPFAAVLFGAVLAGPPEPVYSPTTHAASISKRLQEVAPKLAAVEDEGAPPTPVATLLGRCIGEDRKNQAALSSYLRKAKGADSAVALRTVRLAGLWQAYLASAVLSLSGDEDSKELARFLAHRLERLLAAKS